jgi:hypothetical protein
MPPMNGGFVCRKHGGGAPQVRAKAAWRQWQALQAVADPKRVLAEVGCIGFSNIQDLCDANGKLLPINQWPEEAARAVKSIDIVRGNVDKGDGRYDEVVRLALWDKPRKLENAMKHHGQLTDKLELTGSINVIERLMAGRKRVADARGKK